MATDLQSSDLDATKAQVNENNSLHGNLQANPQGNQQHNADRSLNDHSRDSSSDTPNGISSDTSSNKLSEKPSDNPNKLTSHQTTQATDALSEHHLTGDETRQILTPFAFKIDKSLFGLPLASPFKRGSAIAIDGLLIAMLSSAPGELLAIVIAITLYRLGSQQRAEEMGYTKGRKRRKFMRFIAAFSVFVVLLSVLPDAFDDLGWSDSNKYYDGGYSGKGYTDLNSVIDQEEAVSVSDQLMISVAFGKVVSELSDSDCETVDCWYQALSPSVTILNETSISNENKRTLINETVTGLEVPADQQKALISKLSALLTETESDENAISKQLISGDLAKVAEPNANSADQASQDNLRNLDNQESNSSSTEIPSTTDKPVYSLVELVKGIINDLGLGFGWAAFYFTALTAVWGGQTPGKKLFGIRVIQLDGTPLSIWDSFGRYGGYGAGIATGLLGFIQIFWDANRQAIHDKISATVVIDTRAYSKAKIQ
ncbi:RDD family protein [Thalassotalea montiporae]